MAGLELGGRRRRFLLIAVSIYALLCVGGILLHSFLSSRSFELRREQFIALYLLELALMLFLAPLLSIRGIILEKQDERLLQLLPDRKGALRIALRSVAFPLFVAVILSLVPGLAALLVKALFGGVPALVLIRASAVVMFMALGAAAVGCYCSVRCADMFSSAGLALLFVILLILEPIWLGPVIGSAPFLIQPSLLINPFAGLASAMDFDLFRTEPLYQICPIGQLRFEYPAWWSVAVLYVSMTFLFLWRSVVGIRRMAEPSK